MFADLFANHVVGVNSRENRPKALQTGRMYRISQVKECNILYSSIISNVKGNVFHVKLYYILYCLEPFKLLYILEQLYSALEYLCIPLPKGFQDLFATVAFKCLPKRVFVQYMERGIVVIGRRFVLDVLSPALTACNTNTHMATYIASQSIDIQEAIFVLQQSKPHILYVVQYLLSAYFATHLVARTKHSQTGSKNMDWVEDTKFVPFSTFMHSLNSVLGPVQQDFDNLNNSGGSGKLPGSGSFGNLGLVSLWNSLPYMGMVNSNTRIEKITKDVEAVLKQLLELINMNCGYMLDQIIGVTITNKRD